MRWHRVVAVAIVALAAALIVGTAFMQVLNKLTSPPSDVLFGNVLFQICLLYTSPSPRDVEESRMPSSA